MYQERNESSRPHTNKTEFGWSTMKIWFAFLFIGSASCLRLPFTKASPYRGGSVATFDDEDLSDEDLALPLGSSQPNPSRDDPLMADIELLSSILSDIVNLEDPKVHQLYEQFRAWSLQRAEELKTGAKHGEALQQMVQAARQLTAREALGVTRTFTAMLNLVNSAEVQHRNRMVRAYASKDPQGGPLPHTQDSIRGTFDALLELGHGPDEILNQLCRQKVEIVLTAHPTQVQRKSLLRKYRQVSEVLATLDRQDLDGYERMACVLDLKRIVSSIWGADEIRRTKPTPQQEAAGGNAVLESVLWDAVPAYLRKLDQQCRLTLGKGLPVDVCPIKFASWVSQKLVIV